MITLFNSRTCKFPSTSRQITTPSLNCISSKDGDKNKICSICVILRIEYDIISIQYFPYCPALHAQWRWWWRWWRWWLTWLQLVRSQLSFFFLIFFNVYLFLRQRETEHERGRGKERGRHRIRSRLQALSHQPRAQHGARTHGPLDRDLSWSRTPNQLSHPGAPKLTNCYLD